MDDLLADLRYHWEGAYDISSPAPDVYLAVRTDNRRILKAHTPHLLREKIQADYLAEPVPR